jgi:LacI family transcriptional regulator
MAELFGSRNRPQALFTANNVSTTWVIEALRELNIEVGRDVALVGFDDVEFYALLTPPVTAITQPAAELGHISAQLLLQRIRGEQNGSSVRTVLPVTLIVRESCGCNKNGTTPTPVGGKPKLKSAETTVSYKTATQAASKPART